MCLRYCGIFNDYFITCLLLSAEVKEFRKLVDIWHSYVPESCHSVFFYLRGISCVCGCSTVIYMFLKTSNPSPSSGDTGDQLTSNPSSSNVETNDPLTSKASPSSGETSDPLLSNVGFFIPFVHITSKSILCHVWKLLLVSKFVNWYIFQDLSRFGWEPNGAPKNLWNCLREFLTGWMLLL